MFKSFKQLWNFISFLGIKHQETLNPDEQRRRIFFNKSLFIGFFCILLQIFYSFLFIGNYGFLNLITAIALAVALFIHYKGNYSAAKRISSYSTFAMSIVITALSGGDFLYHSSAIALLTFTWILFDSKNERIELGLFLGFTIFIYCIGEFNLFNAPDFSSHPDTPPARIISLTISTILVIVFLHFFKTLSLEYQNKLATALAQKEILLSEVLVKSKVLEHERNVLEEIIFERTMTLQQQKTSLEQKNEEKEVLLKEVHHRVKNNLQIIVSLLNLQASKINDKSALIALKETQNRVLSMSLVHQKIYQSSNFSAVNFRDYIELLIDNYKSIFIEHDYKVTYINKTSSEIKIDMDTAIPLGLIINEMFTNSFKHAFSDVNKDYSLSISLDAFEGKKFNLIFKDNGIGLPEHFNSKTTDTLGIQLIEALTSQVNGTLNYHNDQGAVFHITFSN